MSPNAIKRLNELLRRQSEMFRWPRDVTSPTPTQVTGSIPEEPVEGLDDH